MYYKLDSVSGLLQGDTDVINRFSSESHIKSKTNGEEAFCRY